MARRGISRRSFLKGTSAAAASVAAPRVIMGMMSDSPNNKLNIACIGVGGRGRAAVGASKRENIVALCDVDFRRAGKTLKEFGDTVPVYKDFRVMLDKLDKDIDAVTVSTPDHTHYAASIQAMSMGKHCFCEKPLTRTIAEARKLAQAAKKYKVATQMGNQGHAGEGTRLMREWFEAGILGEVRKVELWTNRPIWPQGIGRPEEAQDVPDGVEWDLWLGPAPQRPYHSAYLPFKWRGWLDYGTGALGDMGCHIMDASWWALQLGAPTRVEAEQDGMTDETFPKSSKVTYHFPARNGRGPVTVIWYDGQRKPKRPEELEEGRKFGGNGQLLHGSKATLLGGTYGHPMRIIPEKKMQEVGPNLPERTYPRVQGGHFKEWFDACKGGKPAGSNFVDHAGPMTEMVLLGNLAIRTGQTVQWDSEKMRVTNSKQADALVHGGYEPRKGWDL